ncbi:MAG: 16S rRNA (guanine(966)-N(2))-methyltransferase RsmD, partial [Acidimicrobiales bacterium]|nr:16S rRNA (guanine(966)-N(2))-methyltransferase RsmD [Acidimicrobiales bacterium]
MRVVAGEAGGLRLVAPEGSDVRPTSDRVREAIFNALYSMGVIEDATVLDLFAGSGAMGIEALSRGAAHATFVERDPAAIAAIETNLSTTKLTDRATIVRTDAPSFIARDGDRFTLALLDPPYPFDGWDELLAAVRADRVVIESDRSIALPPGWRLDREKAYGGTV